MLRLNFLTRSMLVLGSSAIGIGGWQAASTAATLTSSEAFTGVYQFEGDSPRPTFTGSGINFTPWQAGSGIKTSYVAGKPGRAFTGNGNWTSKSTPDADDYFQFSLDPTTGNFFDITAIKFDADRSATGPQDWQLNAQIGSQAPIVLSQGTNSTALWNQFSIAPTAALANLTQTVTFTLYGYGATSTSGTWRIDNFAVSGIVSSPTTPQNPGSEPPPSNPDTPGDSPSDAVPTPMLLPAILGLGLKLRRKLASA